MIWSSPLNNKLIKGPGSPGVTYLFEKASRAMIVIRQSDIIKNDNATAFIATRFG